ncbi:MAG: 16S rRNA (cytosine(967)-C(5))-methyltransferase RsmB [Sneathiella sp.]
MTMEQPNPRARAVQILDQVLTKHQLLEEILTGSLNGLPGRDRALARAMASTCLRHLGIIDHLIDKMVDRPLPVKATRVRHIIRLGITQILFLNIPSHAAVHDTVELIPDNSKYKGLVNALLRRTDRQGRNLLEKMNQPYRNTPLWLWNSWKDFYGEEVATLIGNAHLNEAALDISVKGDAENWAEKLSATILPTGSLRRLAGGSIIDFPGFEDGEWWIQDAAAALPAQLFNDIEGKRVLDLCAAPGGKTAQLATKGALVTALDRSKARLKKLEENMERLGLSVTVTVADATEFVPDEPFDAILLDAPCSSTGTIRRHPDVAILKSDGDVKKLADLQSRLLDATIAQLKSGGTLVYSTCSLQSEEGEWQIKDFLEKYPEMKRVPIKSEEVGGLSHILNEDGEIRCLPHHSVGIEDDKPGGMDGFFACRLMKH